MMHMLAAHLLMLVALMSTVMAEEYDKCGRPDAVWASWDQVIFPARTLMRSMMRPTLIANHAAWTGARHVLRVWRYSERR